MIVEPATVEPDVTPAPPYSGQVPPEPAGAEPDTSPEAETPSSGTPVIAESQPEPSEDAPTTGVATTDEPVPEDIPEPTPEPDAGESVMEDAEDSAEPEGSPPPGTTAPDERTTPVDTRHLRRALADLVKDDDGPVEEKVENVTPRVVSSGRIESSDGSERVVRPKPFPDGSILPAKPGLLQTVKNKTAAPVTAGSEVISYLVRRARKPRNGRR